MVLLNTLLVRKGRLKETQNISFGHFAFLWDCSESLLNELYDFKLRNINSHRLWACAMDNPSIGLYTFCKQTMHGLNFPDQMLRHLPVRQWTPVLHGDMTVVLQCVLFLLTGVGKTTLVQKVCEALVSSGVGVEGFYTEEVREGGQRVGFDVVTVTGERGHLSRIR